MKNSRKTDLKIFAENMISSKRKLATLGISLKSSRKNLFFLSFFIEKIDFPSTFHPTKNVSMFEFLTRYDTMTRSVNVSLCIECILAETGK